MRDREILHRRGGKGTSAAESVPSFLVGESVAEVHARLLDCDPLRLREATARRLRERWLLLDPDRLFHRALAVCAIGAVHGERPDGSSVWIRQHVDLAIEQLLRADREAELSHPELLDEEATSFPLLTECLMLEPELVRAASVAFNALEDTPRRAFFELLVEGKDLGPCIEGGPWDADGLYAAVRQAMKAVGLDDQREDTQDRQKREER